MVDRISTLQIYQSGVNSILQRQAEVARTQQELASGQRIQSPSDDPAGAIRILDIEEDLRQIDQYQRNASLAEGQLALEDNTLGNITNVLQRVRELTVQANNATLTAEQRGNIAVEIEARLDEILALANTRDSNEEFIFAGFQAGSQPFTESGGVVSYAGDDGQRFLDIAEGSQVAVRDAGSRIFLGVPGGNGSFDFSVSGNAGTAVVDEASATNSYVRDDYTITFIQALPTDPVTYEVTDSSAAVVATGNYTAGEPIEFNGAQVVVEGEPVDGDTIEIDGAPSQSIFDTVSGIAAALNGATDDPAGVAEVNNLLASGIYNLDEAIGNVLEVRTDVGARMNRVSAQQSINEDFNLQLQTALSDVQDIDYADAISRLNLQLVALQAAQQTFVTTQRLSLFDYI
ncbi:MAG: flagellar hook-associated protein FlgL [Pseudomonadota bacterium]